MKRLTRHLRPGALRLPVAPCVLAFLMGSFAAPGRGQGPSYSILYSFQCGTDGRYPEGNLLADGTGNLYGTTPAGGIFDYGTVYEVFPDGTETVLHSFEGPPNDGENPYAGLLRDSAGNLYGTTYYGGSNCLIAGAPGCGTVFEVSATGTETVLYSFGASPTDGFGPQGGLVRDGAGNLYGTTAYGGANGGGVGGGTVFKLPPSGKETVLHSFASGEGPSADGSVPSTTLITDGAGNLYGTTVIGGEGPCEYGCGTVFKVEKTGQETVLHSFAGAPTDGLSPSSPLLRDAEGSLYGTTEWGGQNGATCFSNVAGCGTVFKLAADSTETVLFSFSGGAGGYQPSGDLVKDGKGDVYGVTLLGGDTACDSPGGCGTLFELGPTGKEGSLHKFAGPPADGSLPDALLFTGGALYGSASGGGAYNCGTVFKITP